MSRRFIARRRQSNMRGLLLFAAVFLAALLLFALGVDRVSRQTDQRAAQTLRTAIGRSVARCYALEGAYPESLERLTEEYGLVYDTARFYVDYHANGRNLLPTVVVIEREVQP